MKNLIVLLVVFAASCSVSYAAQTKSAANTSAQVTQAIAMDASATIDAATSLNPTTAIDDAPDVPPALVVNDPLEGFNRVMFNFNDALDNVLVKPFATFYNIIMPKPLNEGIHNFYNNIGELPTIANDILQLNFYQMANDMWRFAINSTIGILGFFDVASRMDLKFYANDFGLTLGHYGWRNSTYLVLPFFGPNTFRDVIEIPVDYTAFSIYPYIEPQSRRYQVYGLGVLDRRSQLLQYQGVFDEVAVDRYVFMRNAYMQRRAYQVAQTWHLSYKDQQAARRSETAVLK